MSIFSSRDSSLDFIRICAILAVVIIHAIGTIVLQSPVGSKRWMIGNTIDSFMRWSVPVFVMISGALLIRDKTFLDRRAFLRQKLTRISVPLILWPIIYIAWSYFTFNISPDPKSFLGGYMSGSPAPGHLYFLFLIAGIYLIAPVVSLYAASVNKRQFLITTIFVLMMTTIWHLIGSLVPGQEGGLRLNAITQGLPYIGFFMLGFAIKDIRPKKAWIPFVVFILSGVAISASTYLMASSYGIDKGLAFYAYPSVFVIIMSASAYIIGIVIYENILSRVSIAKVGKIGNVLKTLSEATFGVYLVHWMFLYTLPKLLNLNLASLRQACLIIIITVFFSYAASLTLMRVPYIRILVR